MNRQEKDSPLASNVRIARAIKNLSQAELAKKARLHQSYVSRIESGYVPSDKVLDAVARALETTPGELRQNFEQLVKNLTSPRVKPVADSFEPDQERAMEEAQALQEKGLPLSEVVRKLRARPRHQERSLTEK